MRHPYFHKAVMDAYEQLIPAGEQISYFIYFEVDPANIDVNIHPTKTEIKFENEQAIWQILSAAVKESLGKFSAIPTIDFDTEDMPDIPAFEQARPIEPPKVHYNTDFNPFKTSSASSYGGGGNYSRPKVEWEGFIPVGKSQQDERADGGRAFCRGYGYRYGSKRGGEGSLFPGNGSFRGKRLFLWQ